MCLRAVDQISLRKIPPFHFLENARKQDTQLSDELLQSFLRERCEEVSSLVTPPQQVTEHGN